VYGHMIMIPCDLEQPVVLSSIVRYVLGVRHS
jgi:hypothetical protein